MNSSLNAKNIDWCAVRDRLSRAIAESEGVVQHSDESARALLTRRALALATPVAAHGHRVASQMLLGFRLGTDWYALETRFVLSSCPLGAYIPVPGMSEVFPGVTNLQGKVVPLLDLGRHFGMPAAKLDKTAKLVIAGSMEPEFAIVTHEIGEVMPFEPDELMPVPAGAGSNEGGCVTGVTPARMVLIDGGRLFADPALATK